MRHYSPSVSKYIKNGDALWCARLPANRSVEKKDQDRKRKFKEFTTIQRYKNDGRERNVMTGSGKGGKWMQKQAGRARAATLPSPWLTSLGVGQQRPGGGLCWMTCGGYPKHDSVTWLRPVTTPFQVQGTCTSGMVQKYAVPRTQTFSTFSPDARQHWHTVWYGWRLDQILRNLELLKANRLKANRAIPATSQKQIHFAEQRNKTQSGTSKSWSLVSLGESNLRAEPWPDLQTPTSLQPNIVLWSSSTKRAIMFELPVSWKPKG